MRTSLSVLLAALPALTLSPSCSDSSGGANVEESSGAGNSGDTGGSGAGGSADDVPSGPGDLGFILAQSVFTAGNETLPSQMVIAQRHTDGAWSSETVSDPGGGNVFHKAMCFDPVHGEPGILTISANDPFVKIWRRGSDGWEAETIWSGTVGEQQNRLRDVEIGDVTGDGVDDIVIVSHDQGVVLMLEQKDVGYPETRIAEPGGEHGWIHEVELGDVDGDGVTEIFCTPSAPNTFDKEQPGFIKMYERAEDGSWPDGVVVEAFTTRHVKEVLCTDFFGTGRPVLFASIEGETGAGAGEGSALKLYTWPEDGEMTAEEVTSLPGKLTRFLQCGETNGDGKNEIVAATMSHGIISVSYDDAADKWTKKTVISSLVSSSFEHAIWLRDLDGDGLQDVVAASDKQKRLQSFTWNPERAKYDRKKLLDLDGHAIFTFNMTTFDGEL